MSIVTDVSEKRGIIEISTDSAPSLRVRKVHFAKRPVEIGDEIDMEQYEGTISAIQFSDAYEAALTSLDFSARTAKEIERSLRLRGYVSSVVQAVVCKLTENRLIDDRQLAERIAEANAKKPVGVYALKRKLQAKGISEEYASEALELFDDEQQDIAAKKAAEKLWRRYSALPTREARAKLSQALARRGFGWDAVHSAVEAMLSEDVYD